jgi:hypothetical protein
MQCKYALTFIPTWAPHKAFRSRQKQGTIINALVRIQKYHIYRVIWEYHKGEGKLCFVFKILNVSPIDLTEGRLWSVLSCSIL